MKFRSFVIFPVEGMDVAEDLIIDLSSTDIDDLVIAFMLLGKKFSHCIDRIAIQFFNSFGWVCHRYQPWGDIGEIKIIPIFLIPILGA